ncbi:MAG TPA: lysozyme [Candidatus Stackebrandtia faecavium]|nr:lysozyme [Candidatus Stackebrandtia faecavium]
MSEADTPNQPAKKGWRKGRKKTLAAVAAAALTVGTMGVVGLTTSTASADDSVRGIDVSGHQGNVDWGQVSDAGYDFAYVKATEGTDFKSDSFAQQYNGSYDAGMIRGAYHFALPNNSSGAAQAEHFAANGGGWSADDQTLPGVLDIETNPYSGDQCYGLSQGAMVDWIKDFSDTYHAKTKRYPVIYTTASWWSSCTGGSDAFAETNPVWTAHWGVDQPDVPAGFPAWSFWQHTDSADVPGVDGPSDANVWNGSKERLVAMANGE